MAIESLAHQASTFVDSLTIKPATDQTEKEVAQEASIPDQGDTVSISEEARALVAVEPTGNANEAEPDSASDQTVQTLKDQIKKLKEEIEKLEKSDLPEKLKQSQIQDKQNQLMAIQDQLVKAQQAQLKESGQMPGGGTRANGPGNSAATF